MKTYNECLSDDERDAIEKALDTLKEELSYCVTPVKLKGDDRAARAAEALAIYIMESKTK